MVAKFGHLFLFGSRILPCGTQSLGNRRLIRVRQQDQCGAACSPSSASRCKGRWGTPKVILLLCWRELCHSPGQIWAQGGKDLSPDPEVRMAHMRPLLGPRKTEGDLAKLVRRHGCGCTIMIPLAQKKRDPRSRLEHPAYGFYRLKPALVSIDSNPALSTDLT